MNGVDGSGTPPMVTAVHENNVAVIRALTLLGADLNTINNVMELLLHL